MSAPLSGLFGQLGVVFRFEARVFGGGFAGLRFEAILLLACFGS
jgi:hypothetical protein